VIPAYNESARLGATLKSVLSYLTRQGWNAEVIVVDDGSRDGTADIVRRFAGENPVLRLLENPGNRGKGYSVRNGMLNARGGILLFSDADLSSPIEEAPKLFEALAGGADVAIGSRWLRSEMQTQRQPLLRQFAGRLFNLALRITLGLQFRDTQCGFKAFTRQSAQAIFSRQKIERWGFDPEILYLARRLRYQVAEVPVHWGHMGGARFSPLRDGIRALAEMLRIRWYGLTGKYDVGAAPQAAITTLPEGRGPAA
jgi:dolichyl-phosphate beta-glucosyltransferase